MTDGYFLPYTIKYKTTFQYCLQQVTCICDSWTQTDLDLLNKTDISSCGVICPWDPTERCGNDTHILFFNIGQYTVVILGQYTVVILGQYTAVILVNIGQ